MVVLLDTETSGTSREINIEEAKGDQRTHKPLDYKASALGIDPYSSKAIAGKELSLSSWCIASLYVYHFSTVIDFSSEKYSSPPRSIVVLLDTKTPGPVERFTVRMPKVRLELETLKLQTQSSSH